MYEVRRLLRAGGRPLSTSLYASVARFHAPYPECLAALLQVLTVCNIQAALEHQQQPVA